MVVSVSVVIVGGVGAVVGDDVEVVVAAAVVVVVVGFVGVEETEELLSVDEVFCSSVFLASSSAFFFSFSSSLRLFSRYNSIHSEGTQSGIG